ncbi:DotU family type IV/VI secretion system protein [Myxococcus sp. AM009]|uniref:DotU family type IV/VI secretion system protein n=1 Tax=unclassified Myxococcus TaxID=2648731 RepID=UPI001594EC36|nr:MULTISPECIES: DotU family type IV/VI secretion system protein [unclassified Myxococcus]NVJ01225.1 DotU family type IV/VI secretion system protein [Myxococcus sp. AM009]NVJ19211.1 DotU family type IV/VI secretion system protein [Myxococcus sp. AM010]
MDRVTEATKDCFDAAIQLRGSEASAVPPPETLHHRLRGVVDETLRRAAVLGFSHQDAQDMAYALVALIDEVVLGRPEEYRQLWMPLQLHYFNENVAGDGFFARLNTVRKDPHRHEVLQVYYLCMLFGFQGRYRIRGGELELMTLIDTVQKDLERARPFDFDVLSPHGDRPTESLLSKRKKASMVGISAGALAVAVLFYGVLQFFLNDKIGELKSRIEVHAARNTATSASQTQAAGGTQ